MGAGRNIPALLEYLASRASMPFEWGRDANDCVSFADGAVVAQGFISPLKGLRWSTEDAAKGVITRLGGIEKAADRRLTRLSPALAHRGDVAGVPDDRFGIRLMIIEGGSLVGPGARRLERVPRSLMTMAWSPTDLGRVDE